MKSYELTFLISPETNEEEIEKIGSEIESFLQTQGGLLIAEKKISKINLGYEIKQKRQAILLFFRFQLGPDKVEVFKQKLTSFPQTIRFMISIPQKVKMPTKRVRKVKPEKTSKEKKVELEKIEKKLEQILE